MVCQAADRRKQQLGVRGASLLARVIRVQLRARNSHGVDLRVHDRIAECSIGEHLCDQINDLASR